MEFEWDSHSEGLRGWVDEMDEHSRVPLSSLGTTHWHGGPRSATIPSGSVAAYRYIRLAFVKTGTGFETAVYSLIITGQAMA